MVLGLHVEVKAQLVVEIGLGDLAMKERAKAGAELHASSITRPTTRTKDFQSAVSAARCRLPAALMV